jgi:hypothetical protein
MLTDEDCKKLLERNGNKYTLEEARNIKQFFLELLDIHLDQLTKKITHEQSSINGKSFK